MADEKKTGQGTTPGETSKGAPSRKAPARKTPAKAAAKKAPAKAAAEKTPAKAAAEKTPAKTAAKKAPAKAAAKKTPAKTAAKKAPAKAAAKKTPANETAAKQAPASRPAKAPAAAHPAGEATPAMATEQARAEKTAAAKKAPATPAVVGNGGPPTASSAHLLTDDDIYLFNEGSHFRLWEKMGAHLTVENGVEGTRFAVWAPDAERVAVAGEFNYWTGDGAELHPRGSSGVWEGFVPGVKKGDLYKYRIHSRFNGYRVSKADPFGFLHETPPQTASVVWDLQYDWNDQQWMENRAGVNRLDAPVSIYELHPGSWRRVPEEDNRPLNYREMAHQLAEYVKWLGFTHVELLPIMEHPFYGSWGYQTTGYYAPTSRYGTPQDFKYLVDHLHQNGIGVILDWVPSHFPGDEHGPAYFDGTHLFEHADPRRGLHPDWDSYIYNYGRNEVRSFLISNALYWLEEYHIDGLRVDAVASMLYLDYSRRDGEWIPNEYGGRENLEAISFLRRFNEAVYERHPDVQTIAEESTAWPGVSKPTYVGGLGFGMKWDMGWMHDTLVYMSKEPVHRRWHHNDLTFRMVYAFHENFVLPLSHDEVVHGKGSLVAKMPGDDWQKFGNLRLLFSYMWAQPGKKLLFMGGEFAQWSEWQHDYSLEWHLTHDERHGGMQKLVRDLNHLYRSEPAMHRHDVDASGYEWVDANDAENSVIAFLRKGDTPRDDVLCVFNYTPVPRHNYRVGVPGGGYWRELLNSDAPEYGGSGQGNMGGLEADPVEAHGRSHSLTMVLPPLGAVFFKRD